MKNNITTKIFFTFFVSLFILGCSKTDNNTDFDFSTLRKSKIKSNINKENKKGGQPDQEFFIKELVPYKNNKEILSITKFGKKDPFSKGGPEFNKFKSNFKLKGFLNTDNNRFVFVNYLDKKGTITEDSIGGINSNLLPIGAKVIKIDPKNKTLTINFENEILTFEL
tara:strand:+ start:1148 stop:1648 length:501 start_codon:yes stop_codon:yes gene_type:complete